MMSELERQSEDEGRRGAMGCVAAFVVCLVMVAGLVALYLLIGLFKS